MKDINDIDAGISRGAAQVLGRLTMVVFTRDSLFDSKEAFDSYSLEIAAYLAEGRQLTSVALPFAAVLPRLPRYGGGPFKFYFWWPETGKYAEFDFPTNSAVVFRSSAENGPSVEVKTPIPVDQIVSKAKKAAILANPDLLSIYPALIKTYSTLTGVAAINVAPEKPKLPTKLTPDDITKVIAEVQYQVLPGTRVTTCLLVLQNGAKVVGVNYGSIDPAQHSEAMGRQEAYKDAVNKVWELEGYLLRQRLYEAGIDLEKNDGGH